MTLTAMLWIANGRGNKIREVRGNKTKGSKKSGRQSGQQRPFLTLRQTLKIYKFFFFSRLCG